MKNLRGREKQSLSNHSEVLGRNSDLALHLGCLTCVKGCDIRCSSEEVREELLAFIGDEVPVSIGNSKSGQSTCGMAALDGVCKFADEIALVREGIETEQLTNVQIIEKE